MALAEKLERLRTTKADIKSAIEEKGQDVGEIPFSQYPEKIQAIPGGGKSLLAQFIDGSLISLEIPEEVTVLPRYACAHLTALTSLDIPEGITSIGEKAFYNCSSLGSVAFLGTPETVAEDAFSNCTVLTDIYVPWPEGAVEGAPWGAESAVTHYDQK